MDLARYVVDAVVVEGRSMREVARAHGVSKSWVAVLVGRYRAGGYGALEPRSKRPHHSPTRTEALTEDEIVALRKRLSDEGLDAGPHTIRWHLERTWFEAPSVATIWRVLVRRGFVTPEPKKRPHASFIRFEAQLPNECWQADVTHWELADGSDVEILDFIDDHSRLIVAADVRRVTKVHDVLETFGQEMQRWGAPASVLTDNGAIFNAFSRKGRTVFQDELERLGIDAYGRVTLRHDSRLHHIGIGRRHSGQKIRLYVADLDVRIVTFDGEILRHLELDPSRDYQGRDRELG